MDKNISVDKVVKPQSQRVGKLKIKQNTWQLEFVNIELKKVFAEVDSHNKSQIKEV